MESKTPAPDWWPEWFYDLRDDQPLAGDRVVIAEIEATSDQLTSYHHLFTALVEPEAVARLLTTSGGIGNEATSSGPHPARWRGTWEYEPKFWIDGAAREQLEPLVVGWESANQRVIWPDQGLLMTYGLIPRLVKDLNGQRVCFDDPAAPTSDVVIADGPSLYRDFSHSGARVTIRRDYLQDYATLRSRSLVQVYYAERTGPLTPDVAALLGDVEVVEFELPGRRLILRRLESAGREPILARIWGVRALLTPGDAPVSDSPSDDVDLIWPGIAESISRNARVWYLPYAYVKDAVLGNYEGHAEFQINPEWGSVSLGNQWSVPTHGRLGRDLIVVDLKRLYEGTRRETINLWHSYSVEPPLAIPTLRDAPNVATRTKRIVYALADLGDAVGRLGARPFSSDQITGVSRPELDYRGCWDREDAQVAAHHIPIDLSESDFLHRIGDLHKLVVESLKESNLRSILLALGVSGSDIGDLKSLRLLQRLVGLAEVARDAGLHLPQDAIHVLTRAVGHRTSAMSELLALNELRQLSSHTGDRRLRLRTSLGVFGLDATDRERGHQLDVIYDRLAGTLEALSAVLRSAQASSPSV